MLGKPPETMSVVNTRMFAAEQAMLRQVLVLIQTQNPGEDPHTFLFANLERLSSTAIAVITMATLGVGMRETLSLTQAIATLNSVEGAPQSRSAASRFREQGMQTIISAYAEDINCEPTLASKYQLPNSTHAGPIPTSMTHILRAVAADRQFIQDTEFVQRTDDEHDLTTILTQLELSEAAIDYASSRYQIGARTGNPEGLALLERRGLAIKSSLAQKQAREAIEWIRLAAEELNGFARGSRVWIDPDGSARTVNQSGGPYQHFEQRWEAVLNQVVSESKRRVRPQQSDDADSVPLAPQEPTTPPAKPDVTQKEKPPGISDVAWKILQRAREKKQ